MTVYERKFTIGIEDIGKNREINNKAIIKIFENIAAMKSEEVHFGISNIHINKLSWIVLNWKIKVMKRPIYNETVIVKTWVRNTNRIFSYRDFEMYDNSGNLLIIGTSQWAFINIDSKELVSLPKDAVEAYGKEDKSVFEDKNIKIMEPLEYTNIAEYKILRSDIDVNEHVHNLNYFNIAYEALPSEIYNQKEFDNIEIIYKKQIKYGEEINAFYAKENNEHIIAIKSKDQKTLHALIKLY